MRGLNRPRTPPLSLSVQEAAEPPAHDLSSSVLALSDELMRGVPDADWRRNIPLALKGMGNHISRTDELLPSVVVDVHALADLIVIDRQDSAVPVCDDVAADCVAGEADVKGESNPDIHRPGIFLQQDVATDRAATNATRRAGSCLGNKNVVAHLAIENPDVKDDGSG